MNSKKFLGLGIVLSMLMPAAAFAEEARMAIPCWWYAAPIMGALALLMAFVLYKLIMKAPPGSERMQEIAGFVREGAYAYLKRQYKVVGYVVLVLCGLLAFMAFCLNVQHKLVPFAFITGAFFSGLAGFIGMKTATAASSRTAQGASESLNKGLTVAFRAGSVMGLTVVGLALADISIWFYALYNWTSMNLETITVVMLCFGMGASTQALFARVGGGIYTKAADVGADLVGKVEAGIPEDDPRNPAVIADNVGDNVGDVAGMGADLYESYAGSILSCAALGVAAMTVAGADYGVVFNYMVAPLMIAAAGILASIIGIFVVRTKEGATMKDLLWALNKGIYLSSFLIVAFAWLVINYLGLPLGAFWAVIVGLLLGIIIGKGTEYATASEYRPTKFVASQTETGHATVVIAGIAEGMMSTWVPVVFVCIGTLVSYAVMGGFGESDAALLQGLYGVAIAAVAMLSTLGITLATDAYGPIADNAGGNAEMSGLPEEVRGRTDTLDSLGNTTAAIGKGFAIGSAALTALALLASYVEEVRVGIHREVAAAYEEPVNATYVAKDLGHGKYGIYLPGATAASSSTDKESYTVSAVKGVGDKAIDIQVGDQIVKVVANQKGEGTKTLTSAQSALPITKIASLPDYMEYYDVTLINPKVLVGVFLGVLMVFAFCAMTLKAVGRAAYDMVTEVRRQFAEKKGIMEGTEKPDYARCVAISTAGAQKAMIVPSMIAIFAPIIVGLLLGVSSVLGLLVGGLTGGFCMAVFMANAGGAWDNAKKYIEAGNFGGKGSDNHKAAVTGDTVGDPFKDTSGPSLNILMKLMTMVSIVFAGLVVKYAPEISALLGIG